MTKPELLRLMRLLSAMESVLLAGETMPSYLREELKAAVAEIERAILK